MSHVFDSGLALPQRTILRRGAVQILSALKRPNGYLQDVVPFFGVVRAHATDQGTHIDVEQLVKALGRTPSIGVQLSTRTFDDLAYGSRQAKSELQLILFFTSQHSRDYSARHEMDSVALGNDHADPGLDVTMEHAIELLHGQYADVTARSVKQIKIRREEELVTFPEITIWQQVYDVMLISHTGSREFRTAQQLLTSLGYRVTTDPNEQPLPSDPTASSTIDFDDDMT